jgi:hypothetical protein
VKPCEICHAAFLQYCDAECQNWEKRFDEIEEYSAQYEYEEDMKNDGTEWE